MSSRRAKQTIKTLWNGKQIICECKQRSILSKSISENVLFTKKFKLTVEDSLKHTPATLCTREVISLLDRYQMSPLHTRVQNHVSLQDSIDYLFNSSFWLRGHLRLRSCTSAKQNGLWAMPEVATPKWLFSMSATRILSSSEATPWQLEKM